MPPETVTYYAGDPQASLRASEELLANPNLPDHLRPYVVRNHALAAEALASPTP